MLELSSRATGPSHTHRFLVLVAVLTLWFTPAAADPVPQATLTVPPTAMIGDNVTFTVSLDNSDLVDEGYGPFLDVVLPTNGADGQAGTSTPDGLAYTSAVYEGIGLSPAVLVFPDDDLAGPGTTGCVDHPLAVDDTHTPLPVCGTAGDTLLVIELPFGSLVPDQPAIAVTITTAMSDLADLGAPLTIHARGGFRFGADPLDNPCCDLVIMAPSSPDSSTWPAASVTPTLATISKAYGGPESETATGPDFPRTHTIRIEVATGQPVGDLDVYDDLPDNVAYTGVVSMPAGANIVSEPPLDVASNPPFNRVHVNIPSLTADSEIVIGFFVPQFDANGQPVNPPTNGDDASAMNTATMLGDWTPIDVRDLAAGGTDVVSGIGTNTFAPKSIAVQKDVVVLDGSSPTPGDTLVYTLSFQISDFFAFTNIVLRDVISDGQHWDSSFAPTLSLTEHGASVGTLGWTVTPNYTPADPAPNDGTTTIEFSITDGMGLPLNLLGGCVPSAGTGGAPVDCSVFSGGATTGTITYRTVIQDEFSDTFPSTDPSVDHGDVLNNGITIDAAVLSTIDLSPTGETEDDASGAEVIIANGTLGKSIYAVNGNTTLPSPLEIEPGDIVTYRFTFDLPSSDFENLVFTDYLPLPVFDATEVTAFIDPTPASVPAAGTAWYSPFVSPLEGDTFYALAGYHPSMTTSSAANSIEFDYGTFDDSSDTATRIDVLFTVTVNDEPFADGLFLTNQVTSSNGTTNAGSSTGSAIVPIVLREPYLQVTKGAIGADNPDAVFDPTTTGPAGFPAPPVTSGDLAADPVDSNVAGLDAGDIMSFAIVIENGGGSGAFDIVIHDTIPPGFGPPAGGINLSVVRGDGFTPTLLTTAGTPLIDPNDLFGPGIQLDDSAGQPLCQPYDAAPGTNVIVITYDLEVVDATLVPGSFLQNLGGVTNYAGSEGGPNHVDDPAGFSDTATATFASDSLGKALAGTELINLTNDIDEAVIGELVTYNLTIAVPEGTTPTASILDTLDSGLAFVDVIAVVPSTGVSMEFPIGLGSNPTNVVVAPGGQTVTFNPGNIINSNRNNNNDEFLIITFRAVVLDIAANQTGTPLTNSAGLSWTGTTLPTVQADPVTVIEPALTLTKGAAPTTGDAGDTITFTMLVTNGNTPDDTDTYDVVLSDLIPAGMTYVANSLQSPAGTAPLPALNDAAAPTLTASWPVFPVGTTRTITFQATLDGAVLPNQTITNTADLIWTSLPIGPGPRSVHNPASTERDGSGGVNDYFFTNPAAITVNNVVPSKTLTSTSEPHTAGNQVAVGEIVRYRIEVSVPEGTLPNLQIRDLLPNGLMFLNDGTATLALVSSGTPLTSNQPGAATLNLGLGAGPFGTAPWVNATTPVGIVPTFPLPDDAIGSSNSLTTNADTYQTDGDDPYFKLGDVVNTDSDGDTEWVVIEFNALVSNVAAITAGSGRNNRARVFVNNVQMATSPGVSVTPAEPAITDLSKIATPASGDAGDTIHYTITYTNATGTNRTEAFDSQILDVLPTTMVLQPATLIVTLGGGASGVVNASAGNTIDVTIATVPAGGSVQIEYDAIINTTIPPGGSINNIANLGYTSLPGTSGTAPNPTGSTVPGASGNTTGERQYTGSNGASVSVTEVQLAKAIVATSEPTTGSSQFDPTITDLAIGETVTYHLTATLHEGTTPQVVITDTLPVAPGVLSVVSTAVIFKGANLHPSSAPAAPLPDPVITITDNRPTGGDTYPDQVEFNFGSVLNTPDGSANIDDTVIVEVVARVVDIPANASGTTLVNAATLNFGAGLVNATDVSIEVVVPQLTINKSANPTSGDAGDTIRFTITVNHDAMSSTADAFDLTLDDLVPAGMTYFGNLDCDDGATDPDTCSESGGTVTATWDHFPLAGDATIIFDVTIDSGVSPGSSILNTAAVAWDSLPDDGVSYDRDLSANDDASVLISSPGVIKTVLSTSEPSTGDAQYGAGEDDLTIGEVVVFRVAVTVPEGTSPGSTITDQLPTTLSTPQGVLEATGATVTLGASITADSDPGTAGIQAPVLSLNDGPDSDLLADEVIVFLGTVINTPDNTVNEDDVIQVDITAVVVDVPTNQGGVDDLTNTASFTWTGAAAPIQGQVAVDLVEPRVAVSKTNLTPFGDAGDTITYEVRVAHTGTSSADAFDLILDDVIPTGQGFLGLVAVGGDPLPVADDSLPGHVFFSYPTLPLADGSYTFRYQVLLDGTVQAGASYTNTILGVWDSLPGAGDPNDRPGSDSATADVTINAPALVKVTSATSLGDTAQGYHTPGEEDLAIGELVTYRVTVTFPEGTTSNALVTDQVQADGDGLLEIYDARILSTGANLSTTLAFISPPPPIPAATAVVTFDFGTVTNTADNTINDDDRMVLEVVARVVNDTVNANADHLVNLASLTYLNGSTDDDAWVDVVEPAMAINKTMAAPVDGVVDMTIQLTNSGTAPAYDLEIVDVLPAAMWDTTTVASVSIPAGFTFAVSGAPGDATVTLASDPMATPPLSSAEPAETISFTFTATLAGGSLPVSPVINTATNTVATTLPGTDPGERDEPDVQASAQLDLPAIEVDKSAAIAPGGDLDGSGTPSPGDILRYTITITNSGTGAATNVIVTDPVNDPNTTLVAGSVTTTNGVVTIGNTAGDTTVQVDAASIAGPSTAIVTFDVVVANPVAVGVSQLVNWANVTSDELPDEPSNDPGTVPDDDPTIVPLDAAPDLVITKTDGVTSTVPGDSLSYTLTISNVGNQDATGALVTDTLPTGTIFAGASDGGAETAPGSGIVTWPAVSLAAGSSFIRTVSVTVDNPPPAGLASIDNTAVVVDDGSNGPDPTPGNNTATDVDVLVYTDLSVTKIDNPDPVVAGEALTWTVTVTNNGVSAATGVVLSDVLPAGITLVSISAPCAGGFPCTIGGLAAGASIPVIINVTVDSDTTGTISNTATVTGIEIDPDPTNNTTTEPTTIGQSTDLEVSKTDSPDPVVAGETLTWTVNVTNNGPSDATGVILDDTIPAGVTITAISAPCTGGFPCTIGALAAGATQSVTIDVTVDPEIVGVLSNTADVTGNEPDPDPTNNTTTEPTDVIPVADLVITKTGPGSVASGSDVVYTITVENLGPSEATSLLITDPTPTGLSFVTATTPCDTGFPCTVPSLAAGASFSFDVTFNVPAGYSGPDPIVNTASVSSGVQDPDPTNNTSRSSTAVDRTPEADLEIVKTGPPSAAAGSTVTYELAITNNGPDDAAAVIVDDPTPAGLGFASATAPCAAGFPCNLGTVNSGAMVTVDVTFSIPAGYTTPDPINNTASVSSSTTDPDPSNNTSTDTTPLGADTADLAVAKLGPTQALPGDDVSYQITVTNHGPATATGVVLDDPTPAGLAFVSASAPCGAGFPCALGTILPSDTVVVSVTFNIPAGYTGADPLVNITSVTGAEPDPDPSNNTSSATTGLTGDAADLGVVKTGPAAAPQGTDVTFEITVTNHGPGTAAAVMLDDPTPAGLVFVSAADPCSSGFPCPMGDMAAGSAITLQATFSIPADYLLPDPIVNTATVSTTSPDPNPGNDIDTHPVNLAPVADLSVTKSSAPDPVVAGTALLWTITVTNNGPSDATGVTLDDALPAGVAITAISAPCAGGFPCTIGDLAAGASQIVTIQVVVDPGVTGVIVNTATVGGNETDPDPGNNTATDPTTVITESDLQVTKTDSPDPVVAGEALTWTVTVTNNGASNATGVVLSDVIPAGVTVNNISAPCGAGFPCAIGNLAAGASQVVTIQVTVDSGTTGVLDNTATISGNETDPDPTNNTTTEPTTVISETDLQVTKTDSPDPVVAGEALTWTVTMTNNGSSDATGVVLDDAIPAGVTVNAISAPCAAGFPCTIGNLAAGASQVVTIQVTVDSGTIGVLNNTATISGNETDPDPSNNTTTEPTTVISETDLQVTKTDNPDPVFAGDLLTWTVTVTNNGSSDATGVVLDDTLPPEVTLVAISAPCAGGFPCTIGDLAAGASVVVTIDVTVDPAATGTITNTATVGGNETDPDPTNNTTTEPTIVNPEADLVVVKTASPDPVAAGEALTWTLTVNNNGPSDATGVVVDDTLPPEVTLVAVSAPCAGGFPCTIGDLAVGASVVITIDVTVDIMTQSPISNTATVSGNEPDPDPGNNTSTVVTQVDYVEIELEKTVSDPPNGNWQTGDLVVWTITINNYGTMAGTGIILTDGVPENTVYYPESMTLDGSPLSDGVDGDPGVFSAVDNEIAVDLDPVPAGGSRVVTFAVVIKSNLPNGSHVIPNEAAVTTPTGTSTSNVVIVQVFVHGIPTVGAAGRVLLAILIGLAGVMVVRRRLL